MRLFILTFLLLLNTSFADVGRVLKVVGDHDAYLLRDKNKLELSPDLALELDDEIFSGNTYLVIHLYPGTQMSLAKNTQVKITQNTIQENNDLEKTFSVIDFIKGIVRLQVTRESNQEIDQKIQAEGVSFGVRGTEFEVSYKENKDVDLDVFEGEVTVSSPYIHSFVPEIVKTNEGFRFERAKKKFARRRFSPKFRNHPGFENSKKLKEFWKEKKLKRKQVKRERTKKRSERVKTSQVKRGSRTKGPRSRK